MLSEYLKLLRVFYDLKQNGNAVIFNQKFVSVCKNRKPANQNGISESGLHDMAKSQTPINELKD